MEAIKTQVEGEEGEFVAISMTVQKALLLMDELYESVPQVNTHRYMLWQVLKTAIEGDGVAYASNP